MEKVIISQLLNEIETLQKDYQQSADQLSAAKTERADALDLLKKDLETYQKVIGDFHPSKDSPTYRTLYDENQELKHQAEEAQNSIQQLSQKNAQLKQDLETLEQELLLLRRTGMPVPAAADKKGKRKKSRKKEARQELSDAQLRDSLKQSLLHYHACFTDLQIRFLVFLLDDMRLPARDLARLFDPSMSSFRMEQFYRLLCDKNHIPPAQPDATSVTTPVSQAVKNASDSSDTTGPFNPDASSGTPCNKQATVLSYEWKPDKSNKQAAYLQALAGRLSAHTGKRR